MRGIKLAFETVVRENSSWLLGFVKSKVGNPSIAEDLTQEILLKAYRAYENYCEDGRLKHWLMRIAQNCLRNYFSRDAGVQFFSLDAAMGEDEASLYDHLSDSLTPEDVYLQKELITRVLEVIAGLPVRQRQVITYHFIEERKFSEIASILQIPEGSVKSSSYYALKKIKKEFGLLSETASQQTEGQRIQSKRKGDQLMNCKEIYKYLFIYANNTITDEDRAKVEEHIRNCKTCADIVSALQKLIPHLTFAPEDERTHFLIDFPQLGLSYVGVRHEFENYEKLNELLEKWGGNIPEDQVWMRSCYGSNNTLIGTFDNEGNELRMISSQKDPNVPMNARASQATYIKKIFHYMWEYDTYVYEESPTGIRKAKEAPGLYYGTNRNQFGSACKTALYQAIPGDATNVRIKRGNGVIDCGAYKFPFADRYVTEDESIVLEYSFCVQP